jgi:monolysocardiolipin acyltransferase
MHRRLFTGLVLPPVVASAAAAYWYRPKSDHGRAHESIRDGDYFISTHNAYETDITKESPFLSAARRTVVFLQANIGRFFMMHLGRFRIVPDEHYAKFVEAVCQRPAGTPLLTVSNHRSLVDDIFLFSCLLPYRLNTQPRFLRWTVCSQEYCFKASELMSAYIGAGKVLPIWRGGGVDQRLLLDVSRLVAAGGWFHVFPEGGIWQTNELGGRAPGALRDSVGKLKWGIAKLIVHCPTKPIIVPFHLDGTETIIPQHPQTKKVPNAIPQPGHDVSVRFGAQLNFDDLIAEHEAKYGPVKKYTRSLEADRAAGYDTTDFKSHWASKPEELLLYSKIMLRIECALSNLHKTHSEEKS